MEMNDAAIATTVDTLGALKDHIKAEEKEAEGYKAILISAATQEPGNSIRLQGSEYFACVTFADRTTVDWEKIAKELSEHVSHQAFTGMIKRHTRTVPTLPSVRTTKRGQ